MHNEKMNKSHRFSLIMSPQYYESVEAIVPVHVTTRDQSLYSQPSVLSSSVNSRQNTIKTKPHAMSTPAPHPHAEARNSSPRITTNESYTDHVSHEAPNQATLDRTVEDKQAEQSIVVHAAPEEHDHNTNQIANEPDEILNKSVLDKHHDVADKVRGLSVRTQNMIRAKPSLVIDTFNRDEDTAL